MNTVGLSSNKKTKAQGEMRYNGDGQKERRPSRIGYQVCEEDILDVQLSLLMPSAASNNGTGTPQIPCTPADPGNHRAMLWGCFVEETMDKRNRADY